MPKDFVRENEEGSRVKGDRMIKKLASDFSPGTFRRNTDFQHPNFRIVRPILEFFLPEVADNKCVIPSH